MAVAQIIGPICRYTSSRYVPISTPARATSTSSFVTGKLGTSFAAGSSSLKIQRPRQRKDPSSKSISVSIRCEQSTKESNSVDVWLGRLAMVGFATAISIEVATGKGLLENFGLTTPLPTMALAVTALVGVLTAVFIFQSASKN